MDVLIDATELREALASPSPPVLLDVRWRPVAWGTAPYDGQGDYRAGHLPGAIYVDLEHDLAATPRTPADGRHPLPSPDGWQATLRRWGVDDDSTIVVYDDAGGTMAARAWWLARWAGLERVFLLDGGLRAWQGPLATGDEPARADGSVTIRPGAMATIDAGEVASWPGTLVDARAGERYRGESEPIDPRAGHVPGAINLPTTANLDSAGRFLPADRLRERFGDVTGPVATYCGSGVTAAHTVAALAIAGIDAALYPGSWSQWSNLDRPLETGPR